MAKLRCKNRWLFFVGVFGEVPGFAPSAEIGAEFFGGVGLLKLVGGGVLGFAFA